MFQSTYLKTQDANWVKGAAYASAPTMRFTLHNGDPSLTGANEIAFTTRIPATTYGAIATVGNKREFPVNEALTFVNSPITGNATHWGAWDSLTTGNYLGGGQFVDEAGVATTIALATGDDVTIASGAIRFAYQRGVFSDYFIDLKLNWLKGTAFASAPSNIYGDLGLGLTASGGGSVSGLARQVVTFGANTTVLNYIRISNNATASWGASPSGGRTLDSVAFRDSITSGNLLWVGSYRSQFYIAGNPLSWGVGKINCDF